MRARLHPGAPPQLPGLRRPVPDDIAGLGRLMEQAYRGSVDDEGEDEAAAVDEVRKTLAGGYGAFDSEASSVLEQAGELLAATLVTRWEERPFVVFSMTAPQARRQGLARAGLAWATAVLHERGETQLALVVTTANTPARRLYESLGFVAEV